MVLSEIGGQSALIQYSDRLQTTQNPLYYQAQSSPCLLPVSFFEVIPQNPFVFLYNDTTVRQTQIPGTPALWKHIYRRKPGLQARKIQKRNDGKYNCFL